MKKSAIIFVGLTLCAVSLSAQELTVFEHRDSYWRISLKLNYETVSSRRNYYFIFSYLGEDPQLYRSMDLTIDGNDHFLLFSNITQEWAGVATETYRTVYLNDAVIASLRRANGIDCKVETVSRYRQENQRITFSLSNDAVAQIKQFIR
jgi:hypothetical protein